MPRTLLRAASSAIALTGLLATTLPASAGFTSLVVFGDSLSDAGRAYAMTLDTYPPAPYWEGRFSNGPVAVEDLGTGLGLAGAAVKNYAVGGAMTGISGGIDTTIGQATGMQTQVGWYASAVGGVADPDALFVIWGGANDLRNGDTSTSAAAASLIGQTVGNLVGIVSDLYGMGARHFLLPNMPDLGLTPEARTAGAMAMAGASLLSEAFNSVLTGTYDALANAWSDEHFYFLDTMASQRTITAGSPGNGFTDVTQSCLAVGPACTPDTFLYWDSIHPTAAAHALFGAQMLAAVPEPTSLWLTGAAVLALLGTSARRRRQG